jgi:hypothetical protein
VEGGTFQLSSAFLDDKPEFEANQLLLKLPKSQEEEEVKGRGLANCNASEAEEDEDVRPFVEEEEEEEGRRSDPPGGLTPDRVATSCAR